MASDCFDPKGRTGADEIGPGLSLIKGAGGALLREKLVWEASKRCVVIADAAKPVKVLGKFPLPIEVVAFGHKITALKICDALGECDLGVAPRLRMKDGAPVKTDGGNLIYDAACGRIVKARQQIHKRRLPTARSTNERNHFPGLNAQWPVRSLTTNAVQRVMTA